MGDGIARKAKRKGKFSHLDNILCAEKSHPRKHASGLLIESELPKMDRLGGLDCLHVSKVFFIHLQTLKLIYNILIREAPFLKSGPCILALPKYLLTLRHPPLVKRASCCILFVPYFFPSNRRHDIRNKNIRSAFF